MFVCFCFDLLWRLSVQGTRELIKLNSLENKFIFNIIYRFNHIIGASISKNILSYLYMKKFDIVRSGNYSQQIYNLYTVCTALYFYLEKKWLK